MKKLGVCVRHLGWKRTISTRDRISFHHHCHHHCHHHHLQIVYGFTAQEWGRWEGEQHIIIEDEEGKRCRQRKGAGVGDRNGDDDENGDGGGGEGIQTGSTVWYDRLNRPYTTYHYCLDPQTKRCLTRLHHADHDQRNAMLEERERKGHPSTSRLVETAEPHHRPYIVRVIEGYVFAHSFTPRQSL